MGEISEITLNQTFDRKENSTLKIFSDLGQDIIFIENQEDIISEIQSALDDTTTYQLAKKTGLTCDTIHRVKHNNMKDPRISTILKLLNACGKKLIIVDDKLW